MLISEGVTSRVGVVEFLPKIDEHEKIATNRIVRIR